MTGEMARNGGKAESLVVQRHAGVLRVNLPTQGRKKGHVHSIAFSTSVPFSQLPALGINASAHHGSKPFFGRHRGNFLDDATVESPQLLAGSRRSRKSICRFQSHVI